MCLRGSFFYIHNCVFTMLGNAILFWYFFSHSLETQMPTVWNWTTWEIHLWRGTSGYTRRIINMICVFELKYMAAVIKLVGSLDRYTFVSFVITVSSKNLDYMSLMRQHANFKTDRIRLVEYGLFLLFVNAMSLNLGKVFQYRQVHV